MVFMGEKVVGVLGGMGPESSAELLVKITRCTPVTIEQDHLRVLIDSNAKIPNRTHALLSGDSGPILEALTETALNLERAGAELIGMPCNTAHAFLSQMRQAIRVPFVDMIEETASRAREVCGDKASIGLLATDGTLQTRLYHDALEKQGLVPMSPSGPGDQDSLMEALESVKLHGVSQRDGVILDHAIRHFAFEGAAALIAGCTEVSRVLARFPPKLPWLDPLEILAETLVRKAMGQEAEYRP